MRAVLFLLQEAFLENFPVFLWRAGEKSAKIENI